MTPELTSGQELVRRIRSLANGTRSKLARSLWTGEVNIASPGELRAVLGVATLDAAALSRAFMEAAEEVGADTARGMVVGVCLDAPVRADPELVWTAPGAPAAARRTAQVAAELVHGAAQTAIVVGYSLTKAAAPFLAILAEAARRGVSCSIVADRMEDKLATLAQHWPKDLGLPPMWTRPEDLEDAQSALHAKFIVVDSKRLLVTSANLTYHGFHGNIEMGVLVEGPVAAEAEGLVREWAKAGLIRRVGARDSSSHD